MDARASIVSNNINVLMKTLNIIMIGIMVPTLVFGIFSINVEIPLDERNPVYFWLIMGLASIAMFAFLFLWKRKSDRHFRSRS